MAKAYLLEQILIFRIITCEFLGKLAQNPEYSLNIQDMFAPLYSAALQVSELYNMRYFSIAVVNCEAETNFEGVDLIILY
jgi:hypothetical protein